MAAVTIFVCTSLPATRMLAKQMPFVTMQATSYMIVLKHMHCEQLLCHQPKQDLPLLTSQSLLEYPLKTFLTSSLCADYMHSACSIALCTSERCQHI